ncbi:MAG: disulfide oxidoreductase, partial [Paracoccaceae bacterium]|jgi:ATP-dependent RNA helicase SUPV3L1/SUV3|nr:disulfide oxidoreductase [Paracoccaceae bacterium]
VPTIKDAHPEFHIMSGYRAAGERAIRIDMLERLADMLRAEDSRTGFEAKADMLSITGMTLEQFADLMQGLGYKAERGERVRVKAVETPKTEAADTAATTEAAPEAAADAQPEAAADTTTEATAEVAPEATAEVAPEATAEAQPEATAEPAEMEVFYSFTWGRKPPLQQGRPGRGRQGQGAQADQPQAEGEARPERSGKPRGKGKPQGDARGQDRNKDRGKGRDPNRDGDKPQQGAKTYEARPPRAKDRIDPDNPFAAALMGLRDKT